MGVHGLWKLIEPAGKPVPVETLDNKILAVDVSIWLHQLMKGYQNPGGSSVSNAYLLGLFTRVCKLLFTNIKPVFVFDGGVPQLKRKTIAARQQQRNKAEQASEKVREQLLKNLLKQKAVSQVLEEIRGQTSPKKKAPDMFELPPIPEAEESLSEVEEMSNSSSEEDVKPIKMKYKDLHTIDVNSADFKDLPADIRHDILTELKETRKQNSWGKIHEMPEESGDFSKYQMSRLLKRRSVQVSLEEAEREMGGRTLSLGDVEALLAEGGIEINPQLSKRIASDDVTRYIYVTESAERVKPMSQESSSSTSKLTEQKRSPPKAMSSSNGEVKIKQEVISSDELSDTDLIREVEAIETMHNIVVKEEINEEYGTEDMFENETSSEGVIIDEKDLVKDASGLSQEQILALIKQQNVATTTFDNNVPSTSTTNKSDLILENFEIIEESSKDKGENTNFNECPESKILGSLYFKMNKKIQSIISKKNKSEVNPKSKCEKKQKGKTTEAINSKLKSIKPVDLSALASDSSDLDEDTVYKLPCEVSELVIPNKTSSVFKNISSSINEDSNNKLTSELKKSQEKVSELSSSSGADDEFVEVDEPSNGHNNNGETAQGLQIQIKPNQNQIEDDIFADIFLNVNDVNVKSEDKVTELSTEEGAHTKNIMAKLNLQTVQQNKSTLPARSPLQKPNQTSLPPEIDSEESEDVDDPTDLPSPNCVNEDTAGKPDNNDVNFESYSEGKDVEYKKYSDNKDTELEENNVNENEEHKSKTDNKDQFEKEGKDKDVMEQLPNKSTDEEDPSGIEPEPEPQSSEPVQEKPKRKLDSRQLEKLQEILGNKERELVVDQIREDRVATSLTDQMYQDAQELLRLFGVPYVVAPMEAEAQCAFMDAAGLTQGTITDDSDIWLFGGRKVYKNFFDQKKFVMEFQADNIQHYFKLGRSHLVLLALLVGSDYTVGLQGVGAVTALEILATFPPPDTRDVQQLLSSLQQFKQWWQSRSLTHAPLAKKLKNVDLQQGFPSPAVVSAYLDPVVDDSRESFSWGEPDLPGLRDYAERKFGWSRNRTDQVLLPVVNKLSKKTSQLTLHTFFGAVPNISAHREQMSRRVQSAVNRLDGGGDNFEPVQPRARQPRTRGRGRSRTQVHETEVVTGEGRGRGSRRGPPDDDEQLFIHGSVGKAPEVIPQREKDRQEAMKRKQQAVDILKNKKKKVMKKRRNVRQEKPEANLSESSSDDN